MGCNGVIAVTKQTTKPYKTLCIDRVYLGFLLTYLTVYEEQAAK